jgi:DNA-binding NtrC family response regulator
MELMNTEFAFDTLRSSVDIPRELGDSPVMEKKSPVRRALVVDDEALIRWSLNETLSDGGFDVQEAGTASAALDAVDGANGSFDLVLLDVRLPDSNDLNLLATLRRTMPDTPIVLMTAFGTPEVVQRALELGAIRVMDKPFEMSEIARLIEQTR